MPIKIRVDRCRDGALWYADKVGQTVPLVRLLPDEDIYMSREPAGYLNIVHKADGTLVEVPDDK